MMPVWNADEDPDRPDVDRCHHGIPMDEPCDACADEEDEDNPDDDEEDD